MVYNLVISGTIGSWWNGCSADYVRYVLNKNSGKEVHVGFCSLGGFVKDGLEINQAFRDHGNVHAHAFGMNASISTIAMLGCKTIDIVKGSFFLIHNVSTLIYKYEQSNKEQIDAFVRKLQAQRDSLKNFDDVLASMYADKTGKSVDECLAQMKKGNWLTAQQALDFGLVDSIREDKEAEKAANEFTGQFTNSYNISQFKDAGIPPLPQSLASEDAAARVASVVDGSGNPTPSFIEKTCEGLKNLFRNQHASKTSNKMIKIFACVMALLNAADGFATNEDGNITLTQEQMKSIDFRNLKRKTRLTQRRCLKPARLSRNSRTNSQRLRTSPRRRMLRSQLSRPLLAPLLLIILPTARRVSPRRTCLTLLKMYNYGFC